MKIGLAFGHYLLAGILSIGSAITLAPLSSLAETAEKPDIQIQTALEERTASFCASVLPNWLTSRGGLDDPVVRAIVTDCYVGKIRLAVLGQGGNLEGSTLSELPSTLLSKETGMNLDPYAPIAGKRIWSVGENQE